MPATPPFLFLLRNAAWTSGPQSWPVHPRRHTPSSTRVEATPSAASDETARGPRIAPPVARTPQRVFRALREHSRARSRAVEQTHDPLSHGEIARLIKHTPAGSRQSSCPPPTGRSGCGPRSNPYGSRKLEDVRRKPTAPVRWLSKSSPMPRARPESLGPNGGGRHLQCVQGRGVCQVARPLARGRSPRARPAWQ